MATDPPSSTKVALITGASRRVGRAIALRLAEAGYDIAFTYLHSQDEAMELAGQLQRIGRRCVAIHADLTRPQDAVDTIAQAFDREFSRLDILVNNASLYQTGGLRDATLEQMQSFMAIHVESPLLLIRQFEKLLRESHGAVVNMSDSMADRVYAPYLAYCASKGALNTLTRGLARELAPDVTVNAIAPGVVAWPDKMPEEDRHRYLKRVPLSRAGTPADVAELVLFLVTGGRYITGQIIPLDGGRLIA